MLTIKKSTSFIKKFVVIAPLAYLCGCASYNASALPHLYPSYAVNAHGQSENVRVAAKAFTKYDCKKYLDRDVISKGYRPVQLFIQNNTKKNYIFSLNRVSLPHATPEEVAKKVHTSTLGRATGYGLGALFFSPILAVPAVVDGLKSSGANQSLDDDFYSKSAKDQLLAPYSHLNIVIFVPKSGYSNYFTVTLIDQETTEPVILNVSAM